MKFSAVQNMHLFAEICSQDNYNSARTLNKYFFPFIDCFIFSDIFFESVLEIKSEQKKQPTKQPIGSSQALVEPTYHRWCNYWGCGELCCNAEISVQKVTPCWETHPDWTRCTGLSFCSGFIWHFIQDILSGCHVCDPKQQKPDHRHYRNPCESCRQAV